VGKENIRGMDSLTEYKRKRPPGKSPEPRGGRATKGQNSFVVQRHDATRLHYDLRLELNGVLKSWAVPKGPSLNPGDKRLAVQTEDHPLDYGSFEGTIPEGNYGAGDVILWDNGTYTVEGSLSAQDQLDKGDLKFTLHGQKLNGSFVLVRIRSSNPSNDKKEWLLIKHRDAEARTDWTIEDYDTSVKSGQTPGPPRHPKGPKPASTAASGAHRLTYAAQAPLPKKFDVAQASHAEKPFSSDDWLYEIKWDGIRALAIIQGGQTSLIARSGRIISGEYPEFRDLAKHVRARQAVLDGEIVVLDPDGCSNFQRIQARFGVENPSANLQQESPPTFYFFDVLYCDGYDVRRAPLTERKQLLANIVVTDDRVRISEHQLGKGIELFDAAVKNGLEGLVAKRADSPYPTGKTSNWLKLKTVREIDAVIGGWTDPRGSRQYFGSLLVGLYEKSALRFIGGVGTGFPAAPGKSLFDKLQKLSSDKCPFNPVPQTRERAHWVAPKLIARVGYAEWTSEDHLRQPRFIGLQPDREARDASFAKETAAPVPPPSSTKKASASSGSRKIQKPARPPDSSLLEAIQRPDRQEVRLELEGRPLKLTHLNKVYFPKAGYTKRDVLSYYAAVGPFILPFLKDRPLVLHRYPNGIAGSAFYQKEVGQGVPDWIRTVQIFSETKRQEVPFFLIDDLASLLYLTNLGCIEHNPFSARADDLEKPDYMFMDLDPTEGTAFARVVRAAKVIGDILQKARLKYFLKTSGATGLHMFIPIERKYGFDQVRTLLEIVTQLAVENEKGLLTRTFRVQDRPKDTVFVDVRQNAYAQSLASVFSLRPREGAPASTPITLEELRQDLKPERWNLKSVLADLPRRSKLWSTFFDHPLTLESALAALERFATK
jgi:bifunctional non-homologous end joining protein LigD